MTDGPHTEAMEFDINWFMHSVGITWGTECRVAGGNEWDTWDNVNAHWVPHRKTTSTYLLGALKYSPR